MTQSSVEAKLEKTIDIVNSYNRELLNDLDEVKQLQKLQKLDLNILKQELCTIRRQFLVATTKNSITARAKCIGVICYVIVLPLVIMFLQN